MVATAKIITESISRAVRLPKAFRMPGDTVYISRNEATSETMLKPKDDDQRQRDLAAEVPPKRNARTKPAKPKAALSVLQTPKLPPTPWPKC